MPRPISIVSPLFVAVALATFEVGCADTNQADRWDFEEQSDAEVNAAPDVRSDSKAGQPRIRRACITYIGAYDRMTLVGDADGGEGCMAFRFSMVSTPPPGDRDLTVRADYWNFDGASLSPAACADVSDEDDEWVAGPIDNIAGSIVFEDDGGNWGGPVRIDTRIEFEEPPPDLPSELAFSGEDIEISGMSGDIYCGLGDDRIAR